MLTLNRQQMPPLVATIASTVASLGMLQDAYPGSEMSMLTRNSHNKADCPNPKVEVRVSIT